MALTQEQIVEANRRILENDILQDELKSARAGIVRRTAQRVEAGSDQFEVDMRIKSLEASYEADGAELQKIQQITSSQRTLAQSERAEVIMANFSAYELELSQLKNTSLGNPLNAADERQYDVR